MILQVALNIITKIICLIITLVFFISCSGCSSKVDNISDPLEKDLVLSGKNRGELEKVIAHFKQDSDSLKLKAAILLLSNMEDKKHYSGQWIHQADSMFFSRANNLNEDQLRLLRDTVYELIGNPEKGDIRKIHDLQFLSASFLIQNIEDAYNSWQQAPWSTSVSFDGFCNYILPYKSYNEYPEDWRNALKARYSYILDDLNIPKTMEDICCAMVDEQKKWLTFSEEPVGYPGALAISLIHKLQKGSCVEWAGYGAEAARAFGIPVAIDYVPQYGNRFTTHKWNALILSDTNFISFLGAESRPGDHGSIREGEVKYAKVYRWLLAPNPESFAVQAHQNGITDKPQYLQDSRIKDVTSFYTQVSDLKLSVDEDEGRAVYLCVFKNWAWEAIAGGFIHDGIVRFPKMGRALLYMPMYYEEGRYKAAGPPTGLMANNKIEQYQVGEEKQNMTLNRKHPFKRTDEWLHENALIGAWFQGANDPEFEHPTLLNWIDRNKRPYRNARVNNLASKDRWVYDSLWREIPVRNFGSFRYLRLVLRKENLFRLGEIEFYSPGNAQPLTGKHLGNIPQPSLAFDGFPGRCIKLGKDTSHTRWVGLDLGSRIAIEKIRFIPADDDNFVEPGKSYELFYWKDRWISAGEQKAEGDVLEYNKVPKGGIYFLRCRDCNNREERPFTYEDGKQVWW